MAVHPQPTEEQIAHYADRLLGNFWNIKTVLREMLASRMFFSEWSYRSKIKSPAELVIGSAIAMGGTVTVESSASGTTFSVRLRPQLRGVHDLQVGSVQRA